MNARWHLASSALGLALGLSACDPSNPCDPGQYADHGACYPLHTSSDAAAADGGGADAAESTAHSYAGFGKACSKSDDCEADAPTCGAPMSPVCTVVNCMKTPDVCPPSWSCLDISAFSHDPTITSACVKL